MIGGAVSLVRAIGMGGGKMGGGGQALAGAMLGAVGVLGVGVGGAWGHGTEVHATSDAAPAGDEGPAALAVEDVAKIVAIFVTFLITLGAGLAPLLARPVPRWLAVANMFSAGTLVAAALVHLLPASDETYRWLAWEQPTAIPKYPPADPYPLAFVLCIVGYMVTLLVDLVVVKVASGQNNYMVGEGPGSPDRVPPPRGRVGGGGDPAVGKGVDDPSAVAVQLPAADGEEGREPEGHADGRHPQGGGGAGHHHGQAAEPTGRGAGTSSALLVGALAFHSVFEGLVVGAQRGWRDVAELAGLLLLHKVLAAASLTAVFLAQHSTFREILAANVIFSSMMPCGIALGTGLYHASGAEGTDTQSRVGATCDAVGAGSLLYVAIVHLMCPTFLDKTHQQSGESFVHWIAAGAGVALMAVVLVYH